MCIRDRVDLALEGLGRSLGAEEVFLGELAVDIGDRGLVGVEVAFDGLEVLLHFLRPLRATALLDVGEQRVGAVERGLGGVDGGLGVGLPLLLASDRGILGGVGGIGGV